MSPPRSSRPNTFLNLSHPGQTSSRPLSEITPLLNQALKGPFVSMEAFETFGDGQEPYTIDDVSSTSRRVSQRQGKQMRDIFTRRSQNPFITGRNTLDSSRRLEGVEEQAARLTAKQNRSSHPALERDAGPSQAGPSRRHVATSRMPLQSTHAVNPDMMEHDWRKSGRQQSVDRISKSPPKTPLPTSARSRARLASTSHTNPVEIFDSDDEDERQPRRDSSPFKSDNHPPTQGQATRSSAFGTHAKKKEAGSSGARSGRERQRSSRSPIKRPFGPARALLPPPDLVPQDEEEEQIEQKDLNEDIENPDGHWQGDHGIYMVATRSSPTKQSRAQQQKSSDGKNILDQKPARDRAVGTRGKDPPRKAEHSDRDIISSSGIRKPSLVTSVELAWIDSVARLQLGSLQFDPVRGILELWGPVAQPTQSPCTIQLLDSAHRIQICKDQACPFLMMDLNLRSHLDQSRSLARLTNDPDVTQCAEPSILIVLPTGSTEASALIDALGAYLRTNNEPVRYIDKSAVAALSSNYPAEYKPDDTRARAAREKERQQQSGKRNGEPSRNRRLSDTLPDIGLNKEAKSRKKEKVEDDLTQSKLNIDDFRRRRSHRLSGVPPVEYEMLDNGQPSSLAVPAPMPGLSAAERNELLFPYPFFLRPEINVTKGDRYRVQSNDFLNDTLIEFGLKHLLYGNTVNERHSNADRVHLFNSFFFTKIATRKGLVMPKGTWPAYDSVRRWTRNANIFDKELVVVPINESYHWYLAVIYNPKAILKERKTTPLRPEEQEDDSSPLDTSETAKQARRDNYREDTYLDELMVPADDKSIPAGDHLRSDDSIDPLDVIDETDGDIRASLRAHSESEVEIEAGVSNGVSKMSLDGGPSGAPDNADVPPLMTDTLAIYRQQNQRSVSVSDGDRSGSPVKKQKLARADADILDSDQCWIMTFDSLGTAHKAAHTHIDRWLKFEARDKLGKEIDTLSDAQYWEATVPQQPNFSDCGLYLVHYAKQMLDRPEEMLRFIQRRAPLSTNLDKKQAYDAELETVWQANLTRSFRTEWVTVIDTLTALYESQRSATTTAPGQTAEPSRSTSPPDNELSQDSIQIASQAPAAAIHAEASAAEEGAVDGGSVGVGGIEQHISPQPPTHDESSALAGISDFDPRLRMDESHMTEPTSLKAGERSDDAFRATSSIHPDLLYTEVEVEVDPRIKELQLSWKEHQFLDPTRDIQTEENEATSGELPRQDGSPPKHAEEPIDEAQIELDELDSQEEEEGRFISNFSAATRRPAVRGTILPDSPPPAGPLPLLTDHAVGSELHVNDDDEMISDNDAAQSDPLTSPPPSSAPPVEHLQPLFSQRPPALENGRVPLGDITPAVLDDASSPFTRLSRHTPGQQSTPSDTGSPAVPSPAPVSTVQPVTSRTLVPSSSDLSTAPETSAGHPEAAAGAPREDSPVGGVSTDASGFGNRPRTGVAQRTYARRGRQPKLVGSKRSMVKPPETGKVAKKAKSTVNQGATVDAPIELDDDDE